MQWTAEIIEHIHAHVDFLLAQEELTPHDIPALRQAVAWQKELLEGTFRTIERLKAQLDAEEDDDQWS
jgi:hypothetical protein